MNNLYSFDDVRECFRKHHYYQLWISGHHPAARADSQLRLVPVNAVPVIAELDELIIAIELIDRPVLDFRVPVGSPATRKLFL